MARELTPSEEIRELQAGTGLIQDGDPNPELGEPNADRSADMDALATFIESIQLKRNPFATGDASLLAAIERGRVIFERSDVGCASCHTPPLFTDSNLNASPSLSTT